MTKLVSLFLLIFIINVGCLSQDANNYESMLNELEDDNQYSLLAKAMIYQNIEKYDSALVFYNKAIQLFEKSKKYGYVDKTTFEINEEAVKPDSQDPFSTGMIYYYTGAVCYKLKNFDCAINNYQKNIKINPNFGDAYYQLALVYLDKEQYNFAVEELNKAIDINPNDKLYLLNRAYSNIELGNYDNAIIDITESLNLDPNEPYSFKMLGDIYLAKGDTTKACQEWKKAKELSLDIDEYLKCKCETIKN